VKYGGNFVKIVGENRGNEAYTVGEIAILAWQHCRGGAVSSVWQFPSFVFSF